MKLVKELKKGYPLFFFFLCINFITHFKYICTLFNIRLLVEDDGLGLLVPAAHLGAVRVVHHVTVPRAPVGGALPLELGRRRPRPARRHRCPRCDVEVLLHLLDRVRVEHRPPRAPSSPSAPPSSPACAGAPSAP